MRQRLDHFEDPRGAVDEGAEPSGRPWLGVKFACSGAYVRVYRSPDGAAYNARCPRCGRCIRFRVGPGGTNQRFFEVRC